jgi:hypothetical protein
MASQSYLTSKRYLVGGYGPEPSTIGLTQLQLRQKLQQATGMVDAWCNGSVLPERADFRGGTVTGEQHNWQIPDPLLANAGSRRVYPNQRAIRTVTSFVIRFTPQYYIELDPVSNLFINASEGYVEVIASQPTIIGYPPIGYWYGLYGPVVEIDYTYGWQFVVEGDACEADSPLLYYASHGNWLPGGTVTVEVDGIAVDPGDITINEDDGSILFDQTEQPDADSLVTVSYTYVLPDAIPTATGIIATDLMGQTRNAQRGMIGLQSLRVAEVAITQMSPSQMVVKNGVNIPVTAAAYLAPYARGTVG